LQRGALAAGAVLALAAGNIATAAPIATDYRAAGRAAGGDRATALRIAHALLAQPLALQLTRVRCERAAGAGFCGLTLSGVKFKRRVDTAGFRAEIDALVRGAFATEPALAEVDLWVTVPADAGKGAVVSGDFALPSSATVFAITVTHAQAHRVTDGTNVFWDPAFARELARGSLG
jgi:hypothetical protein